jgi:predicted ATPase/class 3 adenylate cyclase/DNA-binding CsgD family transcriptional regulator
MAFPTGTVTFLFADIEGSTRLLQQLGDRYAAVLAEYRRLFRAAAAAHAGQEVDMPGDACFFAFSRATDAVAAAVDAQIVLQTHPWPDGHTVRARIGVHTGEPFAQDRNYVGLDVHRAARICAAAHGGQVVLSDATRVFVEQALPAGVALRDLGEHRLKDLHRPERLYQAVHVQLPAAFPPLRTLDARPNNLPLVPTEFIGRERELDQTRQMLLEPRIRLVTLTGPGGTGKTRLALQLAAAMIDDMPHGVYFVPLSHVSDTGMLIPAIARALDVGEVKDQPLQQGLWRYLQDRQLLLVLDNLEQLVDSGPLIHDLLAGCPGVKVIATSRERLHLSWEHEFPVAPLEAPPAGSPLDVLLAAPAVALFVDRARMVQPAFSLTAENAAAVAEICARLDGLPLAIELAAARVKLLPPRDIARRLQDQFRLLQGGPVDVPERHRSLQAAMSWSYDLLSPEERRLFRRLAVFRGGFALDSAEAVCRDLEGDVLAGLASLVDKSLLRQVQSQDDSPRFLMLETIRQFGLERLAAEGELDESRRQHAEHFADLGEELEAAIPGAAERLTDRLWRDADNIRAAADWATQAGQTAVARRLGPGMGWVFYMRGQLTEGRDRLARVMEMSPGPPADPPGARAMMAAGMLAWSTGDTGPAEVWLREAKQYFAAHGDRQREAVATAFLGHVARTAGELEKAADLYKEAHRTYQALGHAAGVAWTLHDLGQIARDRGALDEAAALEEQSLAVFRQSGNRWGAAWTLWNLGLTAHRQGNDTRARERFGESLELFQALDDRRGIAQCLEGLAAIAFVGGRLEPALRILAAVDALRAAAGAPPTLADRTEYDRTLEALRAGLSPEAFARAWQAGAALEPAEAVLLALQASESPAAQSRVRTPRPSGLTAREEEVASLVARGLSNREIASTLSIAERTAVSHIEHIMNKLSLHSRAQIAVWAVREGLDR